MKQVDWVNNFIEQTQEKWKSISDFIWENPETRFEEYVSSRYLCEQLQKEGFRVTNGVAGIETAFIGEFGEGKPIIGFLGEFDALSRLSQKSEIDYQKPIQNGSNGHGCGHNLLGTGALAAAAALKKYIEENQLKGTVRFYGCPGEEGGSGKTFMARDGAFDDVDIALTWHPNTRTGVVEVSSLSNIQAYFKFKGRSAHAASNPHLGRSALDGVELMNVGANYLREHIKQEARIHYAITNTGGISPNVVQSEAEVLYLVRAQNFEDTKHIFERLCNIAKGAALMTETDVEIVFDKACLNYNPNHTLGKVLAESITEVASPSYSTEEYDFAKKIWNTLSEAEKQSAEYLESVSIQRLPIHPEGPFLSTEPIPSDGKGFLSGSTDVGDVSWITPTAQCMYTTAALGTVLHSWQMVTQGKSSIAHKGLIQVSKVLALTAIKALENQEIIEQANKELQEQLVDHPYHCPIPRDVKPSKQRESLLV
ncbi:M20 family metallopeptidase [Neobacillus drentensis]|uniref:M20 family metallopeptidase n=1 Tax=Neobacillus drentensis TaxID=220684 RepID=UPI003002DD45